MIIKNQSMALLSFCVILMSNADAQECKPLTNIATIDMVPVPNTSLMSVPATINGTNKFLLLDTGAGASSVTLEAGTTLGLHPLHTLSRLLDADGNASFAYFPIANLRIGNLAGTNTSLMVTPDSAFGKQPPLDGALAPDLMTPFDVEMDFKSRKLNFFSQNHCTGRVIYWSPSSVATVRISVKDRAGDKVRFAQAGGLMAYQTPWTASNLDEGVLGMRMGSNKMPGILGTDIRFTVTIDGKEFLANIDTGIEISTLNTDAARAAFAVSAETPNSPSSDPVSSHQENHAPGMTDNESQRAQPRSTETVTVFGQRDAFEHTFHTLSFGGVTVNNPHFLVRPDLTGLKDPANDFQTGSHVERVDDAPRPAVTIGMNILQRLHLYFAFGEGTLYVTPDNASPVHKVGR